MQLVGKPDDEFLSKISSESVNIFLHFFTLLQMPILIIALAVCSETIVDLILLLIINARECFIFVYFLRVLCETRTEMIQFVVLWTTSVH